MKMKRTCLYALELGGGLKLSWHTVLKVDAQRMAEELQGIDLNPLAKAIERE